MDMKKRGQLTMFIIIGIVIVAVIGGFFALRAAIGEPKYEPQVNALKDNLLECFKTNYEYSIEKSAFQGGYYFEPNEDLPVYSLEDDFFIPYYYYKGKDLLPRLNYMEAQIADGARTSIDDCIEYYRKENPSFDLSYDSYSVDVVSYENEVKFVANVDLTVKSENQTAVIDFSRYDVFIDSDLQKMYEVAEIVVQQALATPEEWIGLSELLAAVQERDLEIEIIDIDEENDSYLFTIKSRKGDRYPSRLVFLAKYNLIDVGFPSDAV